MKRKGKDKGSYLRFRIFFIFGFFILFFIIIFLRAFQLQVLDSKRLTRMAARQHRKIVNIQSRRGEIYDRNLKELAVSIEVDSVYAQPPKIDSPRATARALAPILSMEAGELERKLKSESNFVWLKRQIDLKENQRKTVEDLDGIGIIKESRRYYPNRQLASNLIGFTGLDSKGLEGVELVYDSMLRGLSKKFIGDKDAAGNLLLYEDLDKTAPVQGMVVELTIDKTIQYVTEKALNKEVEESNAKGGVALVMDPGTGEILAMASAPTFDPNDFTGFTAGQWRNRAITDAFEPGSVFKLFLISAALEENVISPKDAFFCENGSYRVADRTFHDVSKNGWLTVPQILKFSSNIGAAKIGEKLGRVQLYRYLKAYGFGKKTGVDLPGEAAGSLRPYNTWSNVTLETVSFGQGVSVTALQLVNALSAVANGGFLMKPYVVKAVRDHNGNIVKEFNPVVTRRVISEGTAKKMAEMLVGVTQAGGTGTKAALDGFEVAGKTGTAQKANLNSKGYAEGAFTSSFFGFVPAKNPRLAIIVVIDEPRKAYHGGTAAAPVFKEIAEQSFSYMDIFSERKISPKAGLAEASAGPHAVPTNNHEKDYSSEAKGVPDFTGKSVRMVLRMAKVKSFDVNIVGGGRAYAQKPLPGQNIPEKGNVVVWFQ